VSEQQRTKAVACIRDNDCRTWLLDYGLNFDDVIEATIRITRPCDGAIAAWLDVEWLKRDTNGNRYSEDGENVATGKSSVPLRSFPQLSPPPVHLG
jgi:hypothetical protein